MFTIINRLYTLYPSYALSNIYINVYFYILFLNYTKDIISKSGYTLLKTCQCVCGRDLFDIVNIMSLKHTYYAYIHIMYIIIVLCYICIYIYKITILFTIPFKCNTTDNECIGHYIV